MNIRQLLAATLAFALCGAPELIHAQQAQSPNPSSDAANAQAQQPQPGDAPTQPSQQSPSRQTNGNTQVNGVNVDPSQGPLQPVSPENQNQPQAPAANGETAPAATPMDSSSQAQQQNNQIETQSLPQNPEPQKPSEPVGAAAAQQGRTAGGAASKPAGTAIAPAKQGQMRSWLIRIGAIAAAGAAMGTIYALSRKSPSTPPGSQTGSFAIH
ncbi:MAG TPA: hypothetical protein VK699_17985 [Terriglobales bacterium]|jgi:hypothetical protein|nr:hypothetical protein [Terriglobales bacterium]